MSLPSRTSLPSPSPSHPSACCRAPVWVPWVTQRIPIGIFLHMVLHLNRTDSNAFLFMAELYSIAYLYQEEKGTAEDDMVWWHHRLNEHESEKAPGVGEEQGSLQCCHPWGCKESDKTEWLNWTDMYHSFFIYSSVDRHLHCFHDLAIVNSASVNLGGTCVFCSFDLLKVYA